MQTKAVIISEKQMLSWRNMEKIQSIGKIHAINEKKYFIMNQYLKYFSFLLFILAYHMRILSLLDK